MAISATLFRNCVLATAIVAGSAIPTVSGSAQEGKIALTCTNPSSGVSWEIAIDFDNATVDSNRATIRDGKIAWFDPKDGGHYRLDRKSGHLSATVASSTGGFARHAHCDLDKAR